MPGFDFGIIADTLHKLMDTDFMDIHRDIGIPRPDGTPGRVLMYPNIPCHIAVTRVPNPNALTVDIMPVISMLEISMEIWIDIQQGDYIIGKKCSAKNEVLTVYRGVCGTPGVAQSRQWVMMEMNTAALPTDPAPIPPPPLVSSKIVIHYYDADLSEIKATMTMLVAVGEEITVYPTPIPNYNFLRSYLDDELQPGLEVVIENSQKSGHEIMFVYEVLEMPTFIRVLSNGLFTRNDGGLAMGWHLHNRLPVEVLERYGVGKYDFIVSADRVLQSDIGWIPLSVGTIIKIFGVDEWAQISAPPEERSDGRFIIETESYTPTEQQANAPETDWYNV